MESGDTLVGRSLGEFVIRERIGEGGFGTVYRAVQAGLEREAVVKVMTGELAKANTLRFLREAKLASRLDHPYAAHVYAFGAEPDGVLWIAMEIVRGTPLDRLLAAQRAITLERFVPLLERICEVVHTAHEQGIVHRDLKPANVMVLSRAGRYLPKLLDFGIAKAIVQPGADGDGWLPTSPANLGEANTAVDQPEEGAALTRRGAIMGSPLYMAPEQWMDASSVDARTDLYALGVLAFECLTGKPPFTGASLNAIAVAHASKSLPPLGDGFPVALDAVLRRAVAKQPADRFASALELATAVREASGLAVEATALPQLDELVRDDAIRCAPHPIAEAVASLEAARNPHQARDALFLLLRSVIRYVGLLTLACQTRTGTSHSARALELLRALHRRTLADEDWLALAREEVAPFRDRRDAFPIPELFDLVDDEALAKLVELRAMSKATAPLEVLSHGIPLASRVLRGAGSLAAYTLARSIGDGAAERWMGVRRAQRATVVVVGRPLPRGEVVLLDRNDAPVLSLAPLVQVAAPSAGAPPELFLFEGRGRRGAKLCAWPTPFEQHDETLWDWYRAQLVSTLDDTAAHRDEERAPYLGLSTFTVEDAGRFFGREALVDGFVNRLRVQPFLAVVGRSGAGKSSFVQAGVIPALPEGWSAITMRPGPSPLAAFAARLERSQIGPTNDALRAHAGAHGPIVLVVDQLEEMFTLCHDPAERLAFASLLASAARSVDDPVRVVVTLRDDFLLRAEQLAPFQARLAAGLQLVTVPDEADLLRALVEPAKQRGYAFDDAELPSEIVHDVADEPSALPLLSFTALKLWELRDRHFKQLTRKAYRSLGGVGGALAQHAEATIGAMTADERRLVREAFRHLVTAEGTRAVLALDELRQLLGGEPSARAVLEKLLAARLLTISDDDHRDPRIEIAHEALLSTWPRLVQWAREDSEGARLRDQLRAAARQWDERERKRGLLWRGDALAEYQRWRARHAVALTEIEQAFADASLAEARRGRHVRRGLLALAFVGLALAIALLWRSNQRTQAKVAQLYEEQGRQHHLAGDSLRAAVYLVEAKRAGASGTAVDLLLGRTLSGLDRRQHDLRGHEGPIVSLSYDRSGQRLLSASYDGTIRLWDPRTGAVAHVLAGHRPGWLHARFSPDGTLVASGGDDHSARVWDAATGKPLRQWDDHGKSVLVAQFDRSSRRLLTASADGSVAIRDAVDGRTLARWQTGGALRDASFDPTERAIWTVGETGSVAVWSTDGAAISTLDTHALPATGVVFAAGGHHAVTGEATALVLWNAVDRVRIATLTLGAEPRAPIRTSRPVFSPDGKQLATITAGGVEVWMLDGTPRRRFVLPSHRGETTGVAFSADGARLATTGADGFTWIWDLATGARDASLDNLDQGQVVAFSPDGHVATATSVEAFIWTPTSDHLARTIQKSERMRVARFSTDGTRIATSCADGTLEIWNTRTLQLQRSRSVSDQLYLDWATSGEWLVSGGGGGSAQQWDARTLAPLRAFPGHRGEIRGLDVSRDGTRLVTADEAGQLRIWDIASGQLVRTIEAHTLFPTMVTFDASGGRIASAGRDRAARVWSVATGELLHEITFDNWVMSVAFDDAGQRLLIAAGRTASIWELASKRQLVSMDDHQREIRVAQFGAGGLVMTASFDTTAKIWDAASGRLLGTFARHQKWLRWGELDPSGTRMLTSGDDRMFVLWELPRETRPTDELAALVRSRVPFELRDEIVVRRR